MSPLKSAYDLACERIIAPKNIRRDYEPEDEPLDFVDIPEFSNRSDLVLDNNETKLILDPKAAREEKKQEKEFLDIQVQEAHSISYGDKIMEVCWNGNFLDYGGFARMNRTMAFGLSNRNVKVKIEIEPYLDHVNEATKNELKRLSNIQISKTAPKVFGATIPINLSCGGKKILYTMIETSEKVHPDYAGKLNLVDEIWVATEYGKSILKKSNVHPPIYVMPLGVDIKRYNSNAGLMDFGPSMKKFKFVSVFRWGYRKGYDILLRAYMREFSAEDDVSLILVSRPVLTPEENGNKSIIEDFNDIKQSIGRAENELPHVALYGNKIGERDMPKIYNSADAFVLFSRGEGFGLIYIEAGACGIPVIGTKCSGQSDFLNDENSYLIEPDDYVEAKITGNLSHVAKSCRFYENQLFPEFREKGTAKAREHMRFVYENYKEAKEKAKKLQSLVVNNYTWDMAVDRVYKRLREIGD